MAEILEREILLGINTSDAVATIRKQNQLIIRAKHIMKITNRIPDWLSRSEEPEARKNFQEFTKFKELK